ncbi:MAG TPA: hypothetical protein VFI56_12185 [Vicinamibacterales bacterium]|nr:hypothetical protein [Vicinamibacterales bacterium]
MSILPVIAAAVLLAQAQPSQPAAEKQDPNAPVTLNGCVQRDYTDSKNANAYTFIENTSGSRYRLAGKSVSKYSGMSVQVVGVVDTKKLRVVGGLWPSPNVAAQAGSIDVATAAVAALPGGPTTGVGNVELPILNVTRLSLGQGECRK